MWFTDRDSVIGRIAPNGMITESSAGLPAGSAPDSIATGADGNLWFTDEGTTKAVGEVGSGVPAPVVHAPTVNGSGEQGSPQVCQGAEWSPWKQKPRSRDPHGCFRPGGRLEVCA